MTLEFFLTQHPRLTRSLKKFIADYEAQLDAQTFTAFLYNLDEEITNQANLFASLPTHEDRARTLHKLVEEETAKATDVPLSCQKGCSACCHMEVEVTSYEAEILKNLVQKGHPIDHQRLQAQSQRELQDPQWKQGPRNHASQCVFLKDNTCSIYEHRPVMCRRHSVSTPPKNCETLEAPITVRYFPRVDLLISAANEDQNMKIGPLAKMLSLSLQP
ncbi:YkgJ family cysteine cluster protein [Bdellovibrio sp. HCB274]|uniref:YkgJ family cysteine cluster protein n=1 Tax=Bdellovibrio sp. HCB274 TaxID=3394361 RepID=UPI0039B57946